MHFTKCGCGRTLPHTGVCWFKYALSPDKYRKRRFKPKPKPKPKSKPKPELPTTHSNNNEMRIVKDLHIQAFMDGNSAKYTETFKRLRELLKEQENG